MSNMDMIKKMMKNDQPNLDIKSGNNVDNTLVNVSKYQSAVGLTAKAQMQKVKDQIIGR
jgi:hypothetical protein